MGLVMDLASRVLRIPETVIADDRPRDWRRTERPNMTRERLKKPMVPHAVEFALASWGLLSDQDLPQRGSASEARAGEAFSPRPNAVSPVSAEGSAAPFAGFCCGLMPFRP